MNIEEIKQAMLSPESTGRLSYIYAGCQESADALGLPEPGHWRKTDEGWELYDSEENN